MTDAEGLRSAILRKLSRVIDPETGADVVRMRLVENLVIEPDGTISYSVRPSSPLCPIAAFLAVQIKKAVASVPGVTQQRITVTNHVSSETLTVLINQEE